MLTDWYNINTGNVRVDQLIAVAFIIISAKYTHATLTIPMNGINTTCNSTCYHHILSSMPHGPVYKAL